MAIDKTTWRFNNEIGDYDVHNWTYGETITEELLDNIETGINENRIILQVLQTLIGTENLTEEYNNIIAAINSLSSIDINNIYNNLEQKVQNDIMPAINAARNEASQAAQNATNAASTVVNEQMDYVKAALGNYYYNNNNWTTIDNSNIKSVSTRLNSIENSIGNSEGTGTLASRIATLETQINTIPAIIGTRLGSAYYNNNEWTTINNTTGLKDIDTRITQLYDAIFGQSASGSSKTILEQIEDLNTAIFGSNTGGSSSGSLINKVEKAMGRSLDLETGETEDAQGNYSNSLAAQINVIKDILGISGSSASGNSNLIEKINSIATTVYGNETPNDLGDNYTLAKVLNDLYGEIIIDSDTGAISRSSTPLINTLNSLPSLVNTLSTRVGAVEQSNTQFSTRLINVEGWKNIIQNAYIDAQLINPTDSEDTYLRLITKETPTTPETVEQIQADLDNTYLVLPKGGGGGQTIPGSAIITRIGDPGIQILTGDDCNIQYKLEARENDGKLTGNGTATWFVGGVQVATNEAKNITDKDETIINTFNIAPYLSIGTNNIILQVSVGTGGERDFIVRKTWTVTVINFSLVWNYNEETIFNTGTVTLEWIPYGADINKTTYLIIDDNDPIAISSTQQTGITQTYTFTHNLSHGAHKFEMYLGAEINGVNETTSHQTHEIIIVDPTNSTPIITASFYESSMEQYDTVSIPIMIYTPNYALTDNVRLADDGNIVDIWNDVDRTIHYWNYSASVIGTKTLTITVGEVIKNITFEVIEIPITNKEVDGYDYKLKASDIISNNSLKELEIPESWIDPDNSSLGYKKDYLVFYQNNVYKSLKNDNKSTPSEFSEDWELMPPRYLKFSNNFDWVNGGLKTERDANNNIQQYICIKAGTYLTINKKIFSSTLNNLSTGFNTKIIMKTANCSDYDAQILECYDSNIGIRMYAHNATLSSSSRYVTTQYRENTYIEIEFEVYENNAANRYMMCWVDGVMTSVRVCDKTDSFNQITPSDIIIGSTSCDVYIYLIKTYFKKLSIDEHLANFIADAPNATTMKARYNRNNILENGEIKHEMLYEAAPDCRIWLYEIPRMTTGKDDKVTGVKFKQIWKNGGKEYYDGLNGTNAILTVQGTSSVNYRKGAANTDISFEDDNATLVSASGEDLLADGLEIKGMKLTDNSIPITYSNLKVNFASCEQVNNMCNAAWYQNFQPYPSLSPRDCMEFVMGVQFILDHGQDEPTKEDPTTGELMQEVPLFSEKPNRQNNKYYMYSIGNLGTSKKNTYIFHSPNECCIEINDNTTNGQRMVEWPEDMDWTGDIKNADHSYGMRYPKKPNDLIKNGWERFVRWMAENNPNAATNETIPEETYDIYTFRGHQREGTQVLRGSTVTQYAGTYTTDSFNRRMAKMLSECEDYMAMDSVIYHFCFIERHTMVDNVAKNTFWSAAKTNQYINGVEQENTEGYWIWDLSKNYDNDTSDGNNNEGQLVFDYGNEANDSINGKMVFNAADSVWFVFASNLREACATMFINRESARSNDGKYTGAWNSLSYHNFLLNEQQKIPERVWNECYRYSYLRPYEQRINTSWISFLDGGQKTHQRRHYESFQELYMASKYMSPLSINNNITLRGYTPRITENMSEELKAIIRATLAAVPSKSEITVTMYNKCYLTVHMGNNILQQKVEKGIPTTLTFRDNNGNYLSLNDTVINIDTASMIQEIGDLSPLYPGQSSFGPAYRLKSIKIGSSHPDYQNLHISETETGAFDFSTNSMLERLEIQNLKSVAAPLSLTGCAALKYLDASGSSFTGYVFADGGLLAEAHLGSPITINMKNLSYLTNNRIFIDSTNNLRYLTIDNCPQIDTFTRVSTLDNLAELNLLNVEWRVQGKDFKNLFEKIENIPLYKITGNIKLTEDMGDFNMGLIQGKFTNELKFYYIDSKGKEQEYYIVSFFDALGELINIQYVIGGYGTDYTAPEYFTEDYLLAYNVSKNPSWSWGDETRYGFKGWDKPTDSISSDLDVSALMETQYRMDYELQTNIEEVQNIIYRYYFAGDEIRGINIPTFERNYYLYTGSGWKDKEGNDVITALKQEKVEKWFATYTSGPQTYNIYLYNTDINGNKGETPLNSTAIQRTVLTSDLGNTITYSDLENYIPSNSNHIAMIGSNEEDVSAENRKYLFLNWRPYVGPTNNLQVTGNMDILLTYYNTDDIFTNYFLNKLTVCDLGNNITRLPMGAFNHNSNLTKLTTKASYIGPFSFSNFNFNTEQRKIFIFSGDNIIIDANCFYGLKDAIIVFTTESQITINSSFNQVENCTILIPNSSYAITTTTDRYSGFYAFTGGNNRVYVKDISYYPLNSSSTNNYSGPYNLIANERSSITQINPEAADYIALCEEAGI